MERKILSRKDKSETDYIFEVDLDLHDYHKNLLFSPEGKMKLVTTLDNKE